MRRGWVKLAVVVVAMIPSLAAGGASPSVSVSVSPPSFSPNGDGVKDVVEVTVRASDASTLVVEVVDEGGAVIRTLATGPSPSGVPATFWWDGRSSEGGFPAADGRYRVVARVSDDAGNVATASTAVAVDTVAPAVTWRRAAPEPLVGVRSISFELRAWDEDPTLAASFTIAGPGGSPIREGEEALARGIRTIWWSGRNRAGRPVRSGVYTIRLAVADGAGNSTRLPARPFRVHRSGATRVIRRIPGAGRMVALTFDDCNSAGAWRRILDVLRARGVKASFFCNGSRVVRFGSAARRTLREGHTVGSHTWMHPPLTRRTAASIRSQIARDQQAWWRFGATPVPYFRPPYGAFDSRVLRVAGTLGFARTMLWDVDTRDWTRPGAAVIRARAVGRARSGSVILLHVQDQTARALGPIITGLRAGGLRPSSLDEMVAAAAA
jgi:peptidoglycan/xylan/chitin deacetylase (PgdA/CDA1 family)